MSKSYTKKTTRSRRKMNRFNPDQMQVKVAEGKASFSDGFTHGGYVMLDVAAAIAQTASRAGILMMKWSNWRVSVMPTRPTDKATAGAKKKGM